MTASIPSAQEEKTAADLLTAVRPLVAGDRRAAEALDAMDAEDMVTITLSARCIRRAMDAYEQATGSRFLAEAAS